MSDDAAPPWESSSKDVTPPWEQKPSMIGKVLEGGAEAASAIKENSDQSISDVGKQLWNGTAQAGIGGMQLLQELGVSTMPAFVDGKIKLVPVTGEKLANIQQDLEDKESGGVSGFIERQAVNPVNYIAGPEKLGIGLKGALQGGLSSLVAPTTDPDHDIGDRALGTVGGAGLGFGVGKAVKGAGELAGKAGVKIPVKEVTPTTDPIGTLKWIKNFVMDTPKPSVSKDIQSLYNAAQKVGLDIKGKDPKQIYGEIKNWYNKNITNAALEQHSGIVAGETHPIAANFAISEEYKNVSTATNNLYRDAFSVGDKEQIEAKGIKEDLSSLISSLKAKAPARGLDPKFDTAIDKLESLEEEIGKNSKPTINEALGFSQKKPEVVTASWLGDLKKTLNQYHVAAPNLRSKDIPYQRFGARVREEIGKTSPEFQQKLAKADMAYSEQERMFSNKSIAKFWDSKTDFDAYKFVKERGGNLNSDTAHRAEKMLYQIKTPADLDTLREAFGAEHRDVYDSIRSAKFYQLMSQAGLDADEIANNYPLIVKALGNDQKSIHLVDAVKTVVEQMNEKGVTNLNPAALEKSDNLFQRGMRYLWDGIGGAKVYALKKAVDVVKKEENPSVVQNKIINYAKTLNKAAPKEVYVPGKIATTVTKPLATSAGQLTQ